MCTAVMGYCLICLVAMDTHELPNRIPLLWATESICKMVPLLFVVAMVTDYKGIQRNLPLVNTDIRIVRWIGYGVWWTVLMFVVAGVYVMLERIILQII